MIPIRKAVIVAGVLHVLIGLGLYAFGYAASLDLYVRATGMVAAHAIAATLCLAIARDYPHGSLLRLAWVLFAGESFCMGSRSLMHLGLIPAGSMQREVGVALITVGATFMIAGIVTTGYALLSKGFTLRLHNRDILCMFVLSAVLPVVIVQRWGWPPALDWFAGPPITIFLTAIASIPLLRFSRQMGNAVLAQANVWILTYMTARCVYQLLSALQLSGTRTGPEIEIARYVIGYGAAWLFAYAAALRYEPIRNASRELLVLRRMRPAA